MRYVTIVGSDHLNGHDAIVLKSIALEIWSHGLGIEVEESSIIADLLDGFAQGLEGRAPLNFEDGLVLPTDDSVGMIAYNDPMLEYYDEGVLLSRNVIVVEDLNALKALARAIKNPR